MQLDFGKNVLNLDTPKAMGILNYNPDSFYDGGQFQDIKSALHHIAEMLEAGASIIDIGGMSSKPGSEIINSDEEQKRIIPLLKEALSIFPDTIFSIDTIHSATAKIALDSGAHIINDISGALFDRKMIETVSSFNATIVLMHMKGTPMTMQSQTHYDDLMGDILAYFQQRIGSCKEQSLLKVIIDPGFGFAKNAQQNFQLLKNMSVFKSFNLPVLVGLSRKSMIYKTLNCEAKDALNGTTALNMIALQNGANILRVHDMKQAIETIKLYNALSVG
jgi:dihydropteroate synthase